MKKLKTAILALLLIATATTTAQASTPHYRVIDAVDNATQEFFDRLHTSPMQAGFILWDALQNGSINITYNLSDPDPRWGGTYHGDITLHSNIPNMQYLLDIDIFAHNNRDPQGTAVQFATYIDTVRFVLDYADLFGRAIGIDFATIVEDFVPLANFLELESSDVTEFIESLNAIASFMSAGMMRPADILETYTPLFMDLFLGSVATTTTAGNVTTIHLHFSQELLVSFFESLYDTIYNDDTVRDGLYTWDAVTFRSHWRASSFEHLLDNIYWTIDMILEDEVEINTSFGLGHNNRLLYARGNGFDSIGNITFDINLGNNPMDKWTLTYVDEFHTGTFTSTNNWEWEITTQGQNHTNRVHNHFVETGRWEWEREHETIINWNESTGAITIAELEDLDVDILFIPNAQNNGFVFAIPETDIDGVVAGLTIAVEAGGSNTVPVPAHTNIRELTITDLLDMQASFFRFMNYVWFF